MTSKKSLTQSRLNMTNQKLEVGSIDLNIVRPESKVSSTAAVSSSSDLGTHKKRTKTTQKHEPSNKTATLKGDQMSELSPEDVIIVVMGPTGSGKSTFINTVAKNSNIAVGHGLESCTSDVSTVRLSFPEPIASDIVFVDTPGFNHTNKTETDVLKMVADWLKTTYEKDILLSGLVYCHRISNTEMDADSVRHLRIFEELCGKDALQNVILATTMWDEVDKATGIMEEEKMKTKYWNKMLERRSTTGRFLGTYESALQLLQPLIDAANFKRSSLLLQHEMVDMGKQLTETSAGRHLFTEVQDIASQRQDVIQRIQIEMRRPVGDRTSLLNMTNQKVGPIDLNIDRPESKVSSTAAVSPSSDLGTHKRGKRTKNRKTTQKHEPSNKTATLKGDQMSELSPEDVIIAVMGPTGSGKSTFINTLAKNSNIAVGHGLKSCTSDVSTVRLSFPEPIASDIVFVDTPGFDHTNKTETDVLKMVADWLKTTYEKDILLSGLVYCHRISDTQMAAASVRHLRTFEKLCGQDALQNVILATTMWDEVDEATGIMEEEKMKTKYWNKMLECGSTTGRFMGTYESALQLLQPLIDAANFKRSSLLLQYEMVDMGKQLTETSAGRHLFIKVRHIISQRHDVIQRIQIEMRRPVGDRTSLQPLHEEHQKLSQSLESTVEELRALNLPVVLRFLETSERWLLDMLLVLKLRLMGPGPGPAKVGEAVDCIESEASPAGGSKDPFKELTELPGGMEAEVDSGEVLTVSREAMIPFEPFREILTRRD